jgi:phosphatidylglycerophosphatase GEP4
MSQFKIGQYFNMDGILLNLKYVFKLHKIKPDISVNSILDLDLIKLKNENNVKYIVFDKDNTLTMPYKIEIEKRLESKIEEFKKIFGEKNLAILSNSAGSKDDKDYIEAKKIENASAIKVVKHKFKKPKVYDDILNTFNLRQGDGDGEYVNKEICVIGDRLLVDILMGKEYGFFTILVKPLTSKRENIVVRFLRKFENFLLYVNGMS